MIFHYEFKLLILGGLSAIAAMVDTLAGGGGLITLPALLLFGLPPGIALGTNKLQGCVGEFNASIHFVNHGKIKFKELITGAIFSAIGSVSGTILVQHLHPNFLNKVIPILLLVVLIYSFFSGRLTEEENKPRMSLFIFYLIFGLLIGFYNGFLGPGTGSFWVVAFIFFMGFNLIKAALYTKPLNFVGDFAALICFMIGGAIDYRVALIMSVGQIIGSYVGTKLVIYRGAKIIRPVFIAMVSIMLVTLSVKLVL